jgi:hypothetical protein
VSAGSYAFQLLTKSYSINLDFLHLKPCVTPAEEIGIELEFFEIAEAFS